MDENEQIHISFQLPASALETLSRLTEQLRLLTAAANRQTESARSSGQEFAESAHFDPERFQALRRSEEPPALIPPEHRDADAPGPARQAEGTLTAPTAEGPSTATLPDPESAAPSSKDQTENAETSDSPGSPPEGSTPPAREPRQAPSKTDTPEAEAVRMEPKSQLPEAEQSWTQMRIEQWDAQSTPPTHEMQLGAEAPAGAGTVVTAQLDTPPSRWSGISEELAVSGAAPLTAEAVSLAFQRDGRRYDNGFPLY